ncbi:hypothetical protein GCM10022246_17890 [Pedobacter ginsengiterrae]|uniref:Uncharacterized protein n=1 Tax=Pedobacter ginsengiterrae TaxID=871696 RepID=A0ABP7PGE6_9SPHI
MATIAQFQQLLNNKARKLTLELTLGKGLVNRIELAGGTCKYDIEADQLKFFNVPEELKDELERKLVRIGGNALGDADANLSYLS